MWKVTRKRKRRTSLNERKNLFAYMDVRENCMIEETHPYRIGTGYRRRAVVTTSFQNTFLIKLKLIKGGFPLSLTCVKFTFANKIEAMFERSHENVKFEPRSTVKKKLNTLYLASILFTRLKFTCLYTHLKIRRQWKSTLIGIKTRNTEPKCSQQKC